MFEVNMRGTTAVMNLYGPIGRGFGGIEASEVVDAIGSTLAKSLEIHLNSEGGSYKDGVAIHNRIRAFEGKTHVVVDGAAWSAGSIVMLAADEREMAQGSRVMIHNAWLTVTGDHRDLMSAAEEVESLSADAAKLYSARTGLSVKEAAGAMDRETWYGPEAAYQAGFTTIEASDAAFKGREYDAAMLKVFKAVPSEVMQQLSEFREKRSTEAQTASMQDFLSQYRLTEAN